MNIQTNADFEGITAYFRDHPDALEPGAVSVEVRETHISYVLLTARCAYKFKKPVALGFIIQDKLEERELNCHREIELNRRLAPEVYLRVLGIDRVGEGYIARENAKAPMEYCVQMKRLPDHHSLIHLLREDTITTEDIERIAEALAEFHLARKGDKTIAARHEFGKNMLDNLNVMAGDKLVSPEFIAAVKDYMSARMYAVRRREVREKIIDGHGDLRPDHIYVTPDSVNIIDCVEFNAAIRAADPIEDIAFVSMALRIEGRPGLAEDFLASYFSKTVDIAGLPLLPLYEIYRAAVRAKVDRIMLSSSPGEERVAYLRERFQGYIAFIRNRMTEKSPPPGRLTLVIGLPASGKSVFSAQRRRETGALVLSTDVIRKRMLGIHPTSRASRTPNREVFSGAYSREMSERVYRRQAAMARIALREGFHVIADGTFLKKRWRERLRRLAQRTGALMECCLIEAKEATIRERLRERKNGSGHSDLDDFNVWLSMREGFESPDPEENFIRFPGEKDS